MLLKIDRPSISIRPLWMKRLEGEASYRHVAWYDWVRLNDFGGVAILPLRGTSKLLGLAQALEMEFDELEGLLVKRLIKDKRITGFECLEVIVAHPWPIGRIVGRMFKAKLKRLDKANKKP